MDNSILYPIFFCFSKSVAFMIIFFEYFLFGSIIQHCCTWMQFVTTMLHRSNNIFGQHGNMVLYAYIGESEVCRQRLRSWYWLSPVIKFVGAGPYIWVVHHNKEKGRTCHTP